MLPNGNTRKPSVAHTPLDEHADRLPLYSRERERERDRERDGNRKYVILAITTFVWFLSMFTMTTIIYRASLSLNRYPKTNVSGICRNLQRIWFASHQATTITNELIIRGSVKAITFFLCFGDNATEKQSNRNRKLSPTQDFRSVYYFLREYEDAFEPDR